MHSLHKFTQLGKLSSNGRVDESLRRHKSASVSASAHSRSARQLAYHRSQLLFARQQKVPKLFRFLSYFSILDFPPEKILKGWLAIAKLKPLSLFIFLF